MTDHDFDDEQISLKAYQIWENNKEQSPEDNWTAAIKALERQERVSREGIKDENGLISNRLTWMTTINGLLFSTLGFSIGKYLSIWFFIIVGVIGLVVSLSTWLALNGAMQAIDKYVKKFVNSKDPEDLKKQRKKDPEDLKKQRKFAESRITGHIESKLLRCFLPQNFLPIIFGLGWFVILGLVYFGKLDQTIDKTLPSSVTPSPTSRIQSTPTPSGSLPQVKATNQMPAAQKTPPKTP